VIATAFAGAFFTVLGVDEVVNSGLAYDAWLKRTGEQVTIGKETGLEIAAVVVLAVLGGCWQWRRAEGRFGGDRRGGTRAGKW